jgi:hypothetical protein
MSGRTEPGPTARLHVEPLGAGMRPAVDVPAITELPPKRIVPRWGPPLRGSHRQLPARSGGGTISRLRIFPVGPIGNASTSQTCRGYL